MFKKLASIGNTSFTSLLFFATQWTSSRQADLLFRLKVESLEDVIVNDSTEKKPAADHADIYDLSGSIDDEEVIVR